MIRDRIVYSNGEPVGVYITCPVCNGLGGIQRRSVAEKIAKGFTKRNTVIKCGRCNGTGKNIVSMSGADVAEAIRLQSLKKKW